MTTLQIGSGGGVSIGALSIGNVAGLRLAVGGR